MLLYNRNVEVLVDNKIYKLDTGREVGYHITFDVNFDDEPEPNVSTVNIYNLSSASRQLFAKGKRLILNAGYQDRLATILAGKIENAISKQDNQDIITTIEVVDSAEEYNKAYVSRSFKEGTKASTIIYSLLNQFGLKANIQLSTDISYSNGKSVQGSLLSELKKISLDCNSVLYTTQGIVYILPTAQRDNVLTVLNSDTGLISVTEHNDEKHKGYLVTCALNNKLTIGKRISLQSKFVNGNLTVVKGRHYGDMYVTEVVVV